MPAPSPGTPPLGRLLRVGGRRLAVHTEGQGSPAIIFLPGAGAVGLDYLNVQERAAHLGTCLVYDRAGTGWSEPADLPRTAEAVTDELRALLRAAGVASPCVLVGHSLGGLYARHFAQRFPDEVAGLVLLDPAHEDYRAFMPPELVARWEAWDPKQALPDALPDEAIQFYRGLFADEMADWPPAVRDALVERHVSRDWLRAGLLEGSNIDEVYDEARHGGPLPDVPAIILCSMAVDAFKRAVSAGTGEALLDAELEGKRRLYSAWAASMPRGDLRLVDAGHVTISMRHPEAVIEAIADVMR